MISKQLFNKGIAIVFMTGMTSIVCAQSFTGSVVSADANLPIGGKYKDKESDDLNK